MKSLIEIAVDLQQFKLVRSNAKGDLFFELSLADVLGVSSLDSVLVKGKYLPNTSVTMTQQAPGGGCGGSTTGLTASAYRQELKEIDWARGNPYMYVKGVLTLAVDIEGVYEQHYHSTKCPRWDVSVVSLRLTEVDIIHRT